MNSIDAIISICVLFAGMGILISVLNEQNDNSKNSLNIAKAKNEALKCASIIDSIASNSAQDYNGRLTCSGKGNTVSANVDKITKTANTLAEVQIEDKLLIKINKHYLD